MNVARPLCTTVIVIVCILPMAGCDRAVTSPGSPQQTGAGLDTGALGTRVKEALRSDPNVSSFTIDVDAAGGVVTLRGAVETAEQREWAARVAGGVPGSSAVKNELVVRKPSIRGASPAPHAGK